jgi:hypothetical protein
LGIVTELAGAAVPSITVTNERRNHLIVGTYNVTAETQGFQKYDRDIKREAGTVGGMVMD